MNYALMSHKQRCLLIATVVYALLLEVNGQSYHFIINPHQRNFDQFYRGLDNVTPSVESNLTESSLDSNATKTNSTVIVLQNSVQVSPSSELSQSAMDIITIVWYVATFLALAAFFMLMACADRGRRASNNPDGNATTTNNHYPPTPTPSYSEFAPPSYESIMKIQNAKKASVFVISGQVENQLNRNENSTAQLETTPTINVYSIDEIRK